MPTDKGRLFAVYSRLRTAEHALNAAARMGADAATQEMIEVALDATHKALRHIRAAEGIIDLDNEG